jgi:hypothetical protein
MLLENDVGAASCQRARGKAISTISRNVVAATGPTTQPSLSQKPDTTLGEQPDTVTALAFAMSFRGEKLTAVKLVRGQQIALVFTA